MGERLYPYQFRERGSDTERVSREPERKPSVKTGSGNFKHTKISSTGRVIGLDYYFLYSRGEEQAGAFRGSGIRI